MIRLNGLTVKIAAENAETALAQAQAIARAVQDVIERRLMLQIVHSSIDVIAEGRPTYQLTADFTLELDEQRNPIPLSGKENR